MAEIIFPQKEIEKIVALVVNGVADEVLSRIEKRGFPISAPAFQATWDRKTVSRYLGISLPTLDLYCRGANPIIKSYRLGNKIRFKQSEVEEALKVVKTVKNQRGLTI